MISHFQFCSLWMCHAIPLKKVWNNYWHVRHARFRKCFQYLCTIHSSFNHDRACRQSFRCQVIFLLGRIFLYIIKCKCFILLRNSFILFRTLTPTSNTSTPNGNHCVVDIPRRRRISSVWHWPLQRVLRHQLYHRLGARFWLIFTTSPIAGHHINLVVTSGMHFNLTTSTGHLRPDPQPTNRSTVNESAVMLHLQQQKLPQRE